MTLRDYINVTESEKKNPVGTEYEDDDKQAILDHFALMDIRRHGID